MKTYDADTLKRVAMVTAQSIACVLNAPVRDTDRVKRGWEALKHKYTIKVNVK